MTLPATTARRRRLGTPERCRGREVHVYAPRGSGAEFEANALPIIRNIQAAGHTSLNAIAGQLNARKVATANGGRWRHVQADFDGSASAKNLARESESRCVQTNL
jgi:hypothetical protein